MNQPRKKTSRKNPYFNKIIVPEKGQVLLCLVAKLWPLISAEVSDGRIVIPFGFYYLDSYYRGENYGITLKAWVESIRKRLENKEILWEPLQEEHVCYADGYFGRSHIASGVLHFAAFDLNQQKEILSILGR